jgi:hypothetical protein
VVELPLRLYHAEELVVYKRKFASWVPWVPMVGGALGVGGGVALGLVADQQYGVAESKGACQAPCVPEGTQDNQVDAAQNMVTASYVAYGVGGALMATGLVMLIVNRPTSIRVRPEEMGDTVAVVPLVTPTFAGLSGALRF